MSIQTSFSEIVRERRKAALPTTAPTNPDIPGENNNDSSRLLGQSFASRTETVASETAGRHDDLSLKLKRSSVGAQSNQS